MNSHGKAHNGDYPTSLHFAQIGSRWSPTPGTRETLGTMPKGFFCV